MSVYAAKKRHTHTTPRYVSKDKGFYGYDDRDVSTSDSSDVSGDIVPHEYDDSSDDNDNILRDTMRSTLRNSMPMSLPSAHDDMVAGIDNMKALFVSNVSNTLTKSQQKGKFSELDADGKFTKNSMNLTMMENHETVPMPTHSMQMRPKRRNIGGGGRKGGKFGAKKRNGNVTRKVNISAVNRAKKATPQRIKSDKQLKHLQVNAKEITDASISSLDEGNRDNNNNKILPINSYSITTTASSVPHLSSMTDISSMKTPNSNNNNTGHGVDELIMNDVIKLGTLTTMDTLRLNEQDQSKSVTVMVSICLHLFTNCSYNYFLFM